MLAPGSEYIFHQNPGYEPSGPLFSAPLEMKRFSTTTNFLKSGPFVELDVDFPAQLTHEEALLIHVHTRNVRVGHGFPGGLADLHDIWLQATLLDEQGHLVAAIGDLNEDGTVDQAAPILGVRELLDRDGNPLRKHEFWNAVTAVDARIIQPLEVLTDSLDFKLPANPVGNYTIKIRWNYRKLRPETARWVWGDEVDVHRHRVLSWIEIPFTVTEDPDMSGMFFINPGTPTRPPYSENIAGILKDL